MPRMKFARLAFATGLFFASSLLSSAQTLVQKLYLFRAETTTVDPYTGMTHTCVLLYPDGHYRLEKSFQGNGGGNPEIKIYVDALSETDLKAWQAVLDDGNFEDIKTAPPHGGIIRDMDTLSISVPREHAMQNINFNNAADRKPFDKALKPFLNSMKGIEKRKVAATKAEKSNNCEAPRVFYRSVRTGTAPEQPPQP
jgi:hypothetical protein